MPSILTSAQGPLGSSAISNVDKPDQKEILHSLSLNKVEEIDEYNKEKNNVGTVSREASDMFEYTSIPYLYSSLFGTILEDTLTQLRILAEGSNGIKLLKTQYDWDFLKRIKYSVMQPSIMDELEGIEPKNFHSNEYKIKKLDNDRIYVTQVIRTTYIDLSLNKSFKALVDKVNARLEYEKYNITLAEEDAKNRLLRRELARQLRQLRNHIKSVVYDADVKIDELKSQVEDSFLNSECCNRYVDNWQRARAEQHNQTIQDAESVYSDAVEYFKTRTDHEHRVHLEVEMLVNIAINETLQKVDDMMNKYDADMEAIDLKIQIKKNDYQTMKEKRIDLEKTFEKHDKLMKDWNQFKEDREKARQYRDTMTKSAIAVQAWWRGLLVRLQLGPYKVKKKPPHKK